MPFLEREGVEWEYGAFEDQALHDVIYTQGNLGRKAWHMLRALARRARALRDLPRFDLVFVYEEVAQIGPALLEQFLARRGLPIVYDFCDPIYLRYKSPTNRYFSYLKFFGKTRTICRLARHVIVGNRYLAAWAEPYSRALSVVPITIDTDWYQPREWLPPAPGQVPIIGWSGSHSTVPHLDSLRSSLRELAKHKKFRLRVIGVSHYELPGVEVEARPWRVDSEVEEIRAFDIGIMPLPSDAWTARRTHLKVRQYMGLAVPAVVSPVGVNTEIVRDGVNGLLASSESEWVARLTRLLEDRKWRRELGKAGRRTIDEHYSARVWAPRVLGIMKCAISGVPDETTHGSV
jgi:glycosyltransferase involved in cell wall biosynthesis